MLAACSGSDRPERGAPGKSASSTRFDSKGSAYRVGKPYQIKGRWYYPEFDPDYRREGVASWYGADFDGLSTANGEIFDKDGISAAHPTLPLPSLVRVTNLDNDRSMVIRVNDRGPFVDDRLIDLSEGAARELGFERKGLAHVRVEFVGIADGGSQPMATASTVASLDRRPLDRARPERGDVVRASFVSDQEDGAQVTKVTSVARADPAAPRPTLVTSVTAAPPPHVCRGGPQLVQVGAFSDTEHVRLVLARLGSLAPVRTEPMMVGSRAVMRVRVGPFDDRDAAQRILAKARGQGYDDAYLVPTDPRASVVAC